MLQRRPGSGEQPRHILCHKLCCADCHSLDMWKVKIWIKWNSENMNFIQFCAAWTLPSRLQHHYISYSFALSNDIFFLHLGFPRQKGNHTLLWIRHRTPLQIVLRAVKSWASWILVNKNLSGRNNLLLLRLQVIWDLEILGGSNSIYKNVLI